MTPKKTLTLDLLFSLLLIASTIYYAVRYVDFSIPPFEDAAMLMRYAQHLADGHGIVWNVGGHPVDGATDFLFMAASALLIKLGLIRWSGCSRNWLCVAPADRVDRLLG